jgi:rSAM/selenodomain-associated transferase 1
LAAKNPTSSREALILFARPPLPGRAKTRLIPLLGESGAADLYRAFLADAAALARAVRKARPTVGLTAEWAMDGESPEEFSPVAWLPGPFLHRAQTGADLGSRMAAALGRRLAWGGHAVLIGTDFPDLPPEIPLAAFEALERMARDSPSNAIIGPASDGGYYLMGLSRPVPEIFTSVEWGTDRVFEATLQKLKTLNIPVHILSEWHDVDGPEDFAELRGRLDGQGEGVAGNTRAALGALDPTYTEPQNTGTAPE